MSTDYAAESNRVADFLGENVLAIEGQTDATMIATALDALRLATLAAAEQTAELVAQQKLANQMAYMESLTAVERDGYVLSQEGSTDRDTLHVLIREGLGLA